MADETWQIAQYCSEGAPLDYPGVQRMAEESVLDWIACTMAGASDPRVAPLFQMLERRPAGDAWIFGRDGGGSAFDAAFLNGASSHVLELDDIERTAYIHPGVATIAAAMALADEDPDLPTHTFLKAVVMGYEVAIRVGRSINPSHYEWWHTTGTAGALGAAAAAAVILGLDVERTAWALGNAGTEAAGLWQFNQDGAMTKPYHVGMAALHGVMAALAAKVGFSGPHRILEGQQGLLKAMSKDPHPERLTEGLGEEAPLILGISRKRWASCRFTHPSIDAMMAIREPKRSDEIESIRLRTFRTAVRVAGHPEPQTPQEAKFSMKYCAALAWVTGDVGLRSFDSVPMARVSDILCKIQVEESDAYDALMPQKMPGSARVTWRDGTSMEKEVLNPEGDPENPIVGEKLDGKVRSMLRGMVSEARMTALISAARASREVPSYQKWIAAIRVGKEVEDERQ